MKRGSHYHGEEEAPSRSAAREHSSSPRQTRAPPRAALRQDKFFNVEALAVEREDRLPRLSI